MMFIICTCMKFFYYSIYACITFSIFHLCYCFLQGHKSYVPNMISGASQADIGVLVSYPMFLSRTLLARSSIWSEQILFLSLFQVISARKGEFETGYERGGQTREHVQLAKTLGVSKLLVVVNKMDEPTVNWSKERCFS